jgi:hypothetical protein
MSQEEWDEAIRRSHRAFKVLTVIGYMLGGLWLLATIYHITLLKHIVSKISLVMPWLIFGFGFMNRGTIKFDAPRSDPYPTLVSTIAPILLVFIGGFLQHTLLSYAPAWIPAALTSVLVALCVVLVDPQAISYSRVDKRDMSLTKAGMNLFVLLIFAFMLSFGWIIESDVALDQSPVSWHTTSVQNKHISRGKFTTYSITVPAWDAKEKIYNLDVGAATYHKLEVGAAIRLCVKEGFLGIPWMADIVPDTGTSTEL